MNSIRDQKISKFLGELSSKSPTPGGGAVAALTGAMAISLVEMVVNLTKGLKLDTGNLKKELLSLADQDCKAFDGVMAAYRSKSKSKIIKSLKKAIEIPQKTLTLSQKIEKLAKQVVKKGNKNALSDAKSAIYLARAAQKAAKENIDINKKLLARIDPPLSSGTKRM